jgi:Co/Zn/Cd efflux system component
MSVLRERHARILYVVLAINALMFIVEGTVGWISHSTSLLADALDMLGDALVYGFSLFVLSRSSRWQASAAAVKGAFMLAFGVGVLAEAAYKIANPVMPNVEAMGYVGAAALRISSVSPCSTGIAATTST